MTLKLHQISKADLESINPSEMTAVSIEHKAEDEKLVVLGEKLKENTAIKIVLVVDPAVVKNSGESVNLEMIKKMPGIRHLTILCFGSLALESLGALAGIASLESFRLGGMYSKKIDLTPLHKSIGLKDVELEFGLADKKQVAFVNSLPQLRRLKISVLDTKAVTENRELRELDITNTLKSPELLSAVYPCLDRFSISYARGINAFDFLSALGELKELSVGYISKFVSLPALANPQNIRVLRLINCAGFDDLESILEYKNLERLVISGPTLIPFEKITRLESLKALKTVYVNFKKEDDEVRFDALAKRNGWINSMR